MKIFLLPPVMFLVALIFPALVNADLTPRGKIIFTQGHIVPACRTVLFKVNDTGAETYFRLPVVGQGDDGNIAAIVLAALVSGRDVEIAFTPGRTTGCGTELGIDYVSIF